MSVTYIIIIVISIIVNACIYIFSVALALTKFGGGTGPIFLDEVACVGSETRVFDCVHNGIGNNDCSHFEDAGVRCLAGKDCVLLACHVV